MGTTPHFTRGKSGKLRPDGLNQLTQGVDNATDPAMVSGPERAKFPMFPIIARLASYVEPPEGGGAGGEQGGEGEDGTIKPTYGGYQWTEVGFNINGNTWVELVGGRNGNTADNNLAYPLGLSGDSVGGAAPKAKGFEGATVFLHDMHAMDGTAYLAFQPPGAATPTETFIGLVTGYNGQGPCAVATGGSYIILPMQAQLGASGITYEPVGDGQEFTAYNTLELQGGDLGGNVSAPADEDCSIQYTYTPVPVGQHVVVHRTVAPIQGSQLSAEIYVFTCALEVCLDCCSQGLFSRTTSRDVPTTVDITNRSPNSVITEMLR